MVNTEKKPSIRKSIRKGIETVGSVVSRVRKALNDMRPKRNFSQTAVLPSNRSENTLYPKKKTPDDFDRYFGMKREGGGKKSGKKTKRNMRKRGTQKRR